MHEDCIVRMLLNVWLAVLILISRFFRIILSGTSTQGQLMYIIIVLLYVTFIIINGTCGRCQALEGTICCIRLQGIGIAIKWGTVCSGKEFAFY